MKIVPNWTIPFPMKTWHISRSRVIEDGITSTWSFLPLSIHPWNLAARQWGSLSTWRGHMKSGQESQLRSPSQQPAPTASYVSLQIIPVSRLQVFRFTPQALWKRETIPAMPRPNWWPPEIVSILNSCFMPPSFMVTCYAATVPRIPCSEAKCWSKLPISP